MKEMRYQRIFKGPNQHWLKTSDYFIFDYHDDYREWFFVSYIGYNGIVYSAAKIKNQAFEYAILDEANFICKKLNKEKTSVKYQLNKKKLIFKR